jgi:UDP-N-acetylglucosamine transferase subunit ALG13
MEMTEFSSYVTSSRLLIMHAGAGSIIHAVEAGKVPVVVPRRAKYREHVDDHQVEFCRELEQVSRVIVCNEISDLVNCVTQAQELQRDHDKGLKEPRLVQLVREIVSEHVRSIKRGSDSSSSK